MLCSRHSDARNILHPLQNKKKVTKCTCVNLGVVGEVGGVGVLVGAGMVNRTELSPRNNKPEA